MLAIKKNEASSQKPLIDRLEGLEHDDSAGQWPFSSLQ